MRALVPLLALAALPAEDLIFGGGGPGTPPWYAGARAGAEALETEDGADVDLTEAGVRAGRRFRVGGVMLSVGGSYGVRGIDADGLPERLESVSLDLAIAGRPREDLAAFAFCGPSLRAADGAFSTSEAARVTLGAGAAWTLNPRWTVVGGAIAGLGQDTVTAWPLLAARWTPDPAWTLTLSPLNPRLDWRFAPGWRAFATGDIWFGSYALREQGETGTFTLREYRARAGAAWKPGPGFDLEASVGWVLHAKMLTDGDIGETETRLEPGPMAALSVGFAF